MSISLRTFVSTFCKSLGAVEDRILSSNSDTLIQAIKEAFTDDKVLKTKIYISIWLDLLGLFNDFPTKQVHTIMEDITEIEVALRSACTKLLSQMFIFLGYKNVLCITELVCVELLLGTFPIQQREEILKIRERTTLGKEGLITLKTMRKHSKEIAIITGLIKYNRKTIKEHSETLRCNNPVCSRRIQCIRTGEQRYLVFQHDKEIVKSIGKTRTCLTCGSSFVKVISRIVYEHWYTLSICTNKDSPWNINSFITVRSSIDISGQLNDHRDSQCMYEIAICGYLERDRRGIQQVHMLCACERLRISEQTIKTESLLEKERKSAKSTEQKLKSILKTVFEFKNEHSDVDAAIFAIANIFNNENRNEKVEIENGNRKDLQSSPVSETKEGKKLIRKRIHILTNDTNYVSRMIKAVTEVPIFYTFKQFSKNQRAFESCLCITEKASKDSYKWSDISFLIEVDKNSLLNFSYEKRAKVEIEKRKVLLNEEEEKLLNEAFTKQRKIFKGRIPPYRLLKAMESLYLSLKHITGSSESIELISTVFSKHLI